MKKTQKLLLMLAIVMSVGITSASAQIYVNIRPSRPVYERTAPPSPQHVWVEEDWHQHNGKYEWSGGRWSAPPRAGYRYQQGRWDHSSRGDRWREGQWQRERRGRGHDNGRHGNNGRH